MQYTESILRIENTESFMQDVLAQQLADIGFESFEQQADNILAAYIPTPLFNEDTLHDLLQNFPFEGVSLIKITKCEDKDWNEEWEKNSFKPIEVGKDCIIRAPFHKIQAGYKYEVLINPKMAFGTGTHQTTYLILSTLLEISLTNKSVLDMGCGTGVLAILTHKLGAKPITAIDIDDWCVENAKENCQLNNIEDIEILLGDARLTEGKHFDIIIANINRNILLMDMHRYAAALNIDGLLIMSGFYKDDIPTLLDKADELCLTLLQQKSKDQWAMLMLKKV